MFSTLVSVHCLLGRGECLSSESCMLYYRSKLMFLMFFNVFERNLLCSPRLHFFPYRNTVKTVIL